MAPYLFRDSFVGRLIYHLSGTKLNNHPEERADYVIPARYLTQHDQTPSSLTPSISAGSVVGPEKDGQTSGSDVDGQTGQPDGEILVGWESDTDPENPQNWPLWRKSVVVALVGMLTVSIYMGSSIYTPGEGQLTAEWGISTVAATIPLSLFVLGYGLGPMFFSPLSEHPAVGRTYIYIVTLFIFVVLQIPTALAKNIGSMLVLRFLAGFFASPALATGAASVGDVVSMPRLPIGIATWTIFAVGGPVLGPLIGGVFCQLLNWRWTIWFLLILDGTVLVFLAFLLPETFQETLLYRKAQRLRKVTGNHKIVSNGDRTIRELSPKQLAIETVWRPIAIAFGEPVVFFINTYLGLMYAILYLWFEAFPIVFMDIHHFNFIETGAAYLSIFIGVLVGWVIYYPIADRIFTKPMQRGETVYPEVFLPPAVIGACFKPAGVFVFAWSSTPDAHWMGPLVGAAIFGTGMFIVFQTMTNYLGMSFYRYQASVFAGNGLFRACFGAGFPLFARAMYSHLGTKRFPVGWGASILAFIATAMIAIPIVLYKNGVKLRARSKYAN